MIESSHGNDHNTTAAALVKRTELSESDTALADDAADLRLLNKLKRNPQAQPAQQNLPLWQQPQKLHQKLDFRELYTEETEKLLSSSTNKLPNNNPIDERLNENEITVDGNNNRKKITNNIGFQLRAFSDDISALEANPWIPATTLPDDIQIVSFSTELVNETLNYFVNCRQRLNQMTKTYDDNDAYILLLQEKEVDLELAARIGQDLLKQNTELRESIRSLEERLARKQDDVQQLKHDLASKASLLDTFIEEEEQQTSLTSKLEEEEVSISFKPSNEQQKLVSTVTCQLVESNKRLCDLQDELFQKGEQYIKQQELIYRLQEQLKDSDRRIGDIISENESLQRTILEYRERKNELYEELKLCKQNFSELLGVFMELQRESRQYRIRDMQQNSNFSFINELDPLNEDINHHTNISFDSFDHTSLDTHRSTPFIESIHHNLSHNHHQNQQRNAIKPQVIGVDSKHTHMCTSLHEEIIESMQENAGDIESETGHSSGEEGTDGGDSGVHTRNAVADITTSASITPSTTLTDTANGFTAFTSSIENLKGRESSSSSTGNEEEDEEDELESRKNWLGLSSFMVSTLVLLCLSVTFNSPANSSGVAQKFQTNCLNAFLKS